MTSSYLAHPARGKKSRRKIRGTIANGQKIAHNQPLRRLTKSESNKIEKMGKSLRDFSFSLRNNRIDEGNIITLKNYRVIMASHIIEQFTDDMLIEMDKGFDNVTKIMSSFIETMMQMDLTSFEPADICISRQVIGELRKTLTQLQTA